MMPILVLLGTLVCPLPADEPPCMTKTSLRLRVNSIGPVAMPRKILAETCRDFNRLS